MSSGSAEGPSQRTTSARSWQPEISFLTFESLAPLQVVRLLSGNETDRGSFRSWTRRSIRSSARRSENHRQTAGLNSPCRMRPVGHSTTQQRREQCRNASTAVLPALGLAATVHIRSMSTVWTKRSVFFAVLPAMALVATARLRSTDMGVETTNAFIVGQPPALVHVAIAPMESMKNSRAEVALGCHHHGNWCL